MAVKRPKRLKYHGRQVPKTVDDDGTVLSTQGDAFLQGVPARDLSEDDIAALSDEQIQTILAAPYGTGTLYSDPDAAKTEKTASPKKTARSDGGGAKRSRTRKGGQTAPSEAGSRAQQEDGERLDAVDATIAEAGAEKEAAPAP